MPHPMSVKSVTPTTPMIHRKTRIDRLKLGHSQSIPQLHRGGIPLGARAHDEMKRAIRHCEHTAVDATLELRLADPLRIPHLDPQARHRNRLELHDVVAPAKGLD